MNTKELKLPNKLQQALSSLRTWYNSFPTLLSSSKLKTLRQTIPLKAWSLLQKKPVPTLSRYQVSTQRSLLVLTPIALLLPTSVLAWVPIFLPLMVCHLKTKLKPHLPSENYKIIPILTAFTILSALFWKQSRKKNPLHTETEAQYLLRNNESWKTMENLYARKKKDLLTHKPIDKQSSLCKVKTQICSEDQKLNHTLQNFLADFAENINQRKINTLG